MGSRYGRPEEQPVHWVEISQGFWLGRTPVTQQQYAQYDAEHQNHFSGNANLPAENLSWKDATAFCRWLNQTHSPNLASKGLADLPTEAQWEYACRAGTVSEYYSGDGEAALAKVAWYYGNSAAKTHACGQKASNAFGLCDMHGNVWEWCRDAWSGTIYRHQCEGIQAGTVTLEASGEADPVRVIRGGAWVDSPGDCRSACRFRVRAGGRYHFQGFRVGLFPGPSCPGSADQEEGA